ncbi:RNA polymerase sigma-70 factor [Pedobacter sp. SD-b]|uniref:RNA polymerase sigma-70 factor n=1 Tax=Pedobacter segetis TaxID=2793069 RepID=A0ABS1BGX0_9SPHI|nr:RNA polymerase sigma-70 factor [Pedobacter segetis]MBK0382090.1 RNA polymerase sigma-70 factor [Pedobacter segetis]
MIFSLINLIFITPIIKLVIEILENHKDDELVLLWKSGNENAFSELYKRYVLKLMAIAVNKTPSRDDAEELVQNSFLKFYQHKNSLEDKTSVFAFLYVILKNQILNYYRKQAVHQKYEAYISVNGKAEDNSLIERIETQDLEKQIEKAIDLLPEKCKKVFLLSRKKNLSNKEISKVLNISENTVEQHMRKALGRLRLSLRHFLYLSFIVSLWKDIF